MLSALISSGGRKPAMLLAEQLAHESSVRPGPLVLGTALLKSPTPTEDRDRHICYRRHSHWSVSGPDHFCLALHVAMQVGLYLHRFICGVRRIVSEDSGCLRSVYSPVPAASIHGERLGNKRSEARICQVLPLTHRPNDAGEGEEIPLLRAHERLRFEEWDDPRQ